MDTALACMKYILFTFNFLLWCMGCALMSLAIWVRSDQNFWEFTDKLPIGQYYKACYVVICVGAIMLVVGFMGCCGAATENLCMLITYFVLMSILMILEFTAAGLVWKISSGDQLEEYVREYIKEHVDRVRTDDQSRRFLNILQLHLKCCGAVDKDDYFKVGERVPDTCHDPRTNNLFYHGCSEMLRMWLEKRAAMMGGMALGIALVQIATMVFSMCLYCALRMDTKDYS